MTELVKGFKDYLGEDAEKRTEIQKIMIEIFERYGFKPAETPIVEYENFVRGDNEKDDAVSDVFKLKDKGDRKLALRYEFTFQLKRIMNNQKLPFKRYQIGSVFRDEPVSANRFRQFTQCDIDTIGSNSRDEAEILAVTQNLLQELGIKFNIYFNNRKLLNEILEKERVKNIDYVMKEIDKIDKLPEEQVKKNLEKYGAENIIEIFKEKKEFFEKYESYKEIKELQKYLDYYGVEAIFLPNLARGLSYYNGSVFEVKISGSKDSITGGGSYIFNGVQCTGISFGLDRLFTLADIKFTKDKYLVVSLDKEEETIKLSKKIRNGGNIASIFYGKPSKALDYANSYKYNKIVFVGEKEIKAKKFMVKDMDSGKEKSLDFSAKL
ncbi:ATP phosphoribosyltransferase regulatory subunit [Candidatus Pacearchaeota archaeon]|nr:ATP phosphoribosyltransferase regulatory subunit [Candidatus Pacearchaeota archaeon]